MRSTFIVTTQEPEASFKKKTKPDKAKYMNIAKASLEEYQ